MTERVARNRRKLLLLAAAWMAITVPGYGQVLHADGPLPSYEVATIKPADPNGRGGITVSHYIKSVFNLPNVDGVVLGGPAWIDKNRYDIQGKMADADRNALQKMSTDELRKRRGLMGQSLLAERFSLKVHFETRVLPVYELVVAKGGPKMTKNESGDLANGLGMAGSQKGMKIIAANETMAGFASALQQWVVNRPVLDKTGITGRFDFQIRFASDGAQFGGTVAQTNDPDNTAPSLFTVIQELGLKLEPAKDPVEVLVIDHIELPSEN